MHMFMLIFSGGVLAIALRLIVVDGIVGWIASRIILQPWQHDVQVRVVKAVYDFAYSTCIILWVIVVIFLHNLE